MPKTICDICMEEYDDNDKSEKCPRILLCGHSFCTTCLKKIKLKNKNIICPTCREIDIREINKITINRAIYDLIWEKKQKINNNFIDNNDITNNNIIHKENKILTSDCETDFLLKIALIGDASTGKTSLSRCFINGPLKNEVNYQITVGLDFFTKIIECGNYLIKLQLWDTAGQERYQSLTSGYLKGVHGCIIVFDVTKRNTFEKIKSWINLFSEFNNYNKNIIIVGNKIDKKNRVISKNEAQNFCFQNHLSYFETSAITGENVFNSFQFLANLIIKSDLFFKNDLVTNKTLNFNSEKDSMCCD